MSIKGCMCTGDPERHTHPNCPIHGVFHQSPPNVKFATLNLRDTVSEEAFKTTLDALIESFREPLSRALYNVAVMAESALMSMPQEGAKSYSPHDKFVSELLEKIIIEVGRAPLSTHYIMQLLKSRPRGEDQS